MTAIIGILNKATVAIAADSAATVSNGTKAKVYNHAHKIFNLSKDAPVGISIYNSAEFMGIPWETLIKIYRADTGSVPMSDLLDYGPHFLGFLNKYIPNISTADEK